MVEDLIVEREVNRFTATLIPFGIRDVYEAVRTALDGGQDGSWLAEQVAEFMDSCGISNMDGVDPNYLAYYGLLQEARNDIDSLIDIDILNDTDEQVYVAANFMCTSLDYTEEANEELKEILGKISEEDKTDAIKWLESELD